MIGGWMSLQATLIAALVPYAAIAAASWRGLSLHQRRLSAGPKEVVPAPRFGLGRTPLQVEQIAVQATIAGTLDDLDGMAAAHMTRLCFAADEELTVRADPLALRGVLADMVGRAILRSPCGTVLVSARRHGGRIEISVIDDGRVSAAAAADDLNSSSQEVLAMHGATLESRVGAHGGTEMSVRLLAPPDRVRPAVQAPAAEPAQQDKRKSVVERSVRSSSSSEVGTA